MSHRASPRHISLAPPSPDSSAGKAPEKAGHFRSVGGVYTSLLESDNFAWHLPTRVAQVVW